MQRTLKRCDLRYFHYIGCNRQKAKINILNNTETFFYTVPFANKFEKTQTYNMETI